MANIDRQIFPIFHLPTKSLKLSIQLIDPLEKLGFSTLSDRSKLLVKTSGFKILKLTADFVFVFKFVIAFDDTRVAEVKFRDDYEDVEGAQTWVEACYTDTRNTVSWEGRLLSRRKWIMHFLSVSNRDNVDVVSYFSTYWTFNSIETFFKGLKLNYVNIPSTVPEGTFKKLLKSIPSTDQIEIDITLSNTEFLKQTIQNYVFLHSTLEQKLTLDTLLLVNSAYFISGNTDLTPKDLNRFIKLWMANSNQRLRYLDVNFTTSSGNNRDVIMSGIKNLKQQRDRHFYHRYSGWREEEYVSGGFEVCRKNGTQAVITIYRKSNIFKMFIWD